MSSQAEKEKTDTCHTDKTVERKGGTGEGRQPPRSPHAQENANAQKTRNPGARAYLNKPLTIRVKLVLLVVSSVKLHLTAFRIP